MYEDMTYENILYRTLSKVPKNMDKRQGSIIFDAIAPACAELAQIYIELDRIINESFADTQTREYLIRRAAEKGLKPYESTKAILKAEFNIDVHIDSKFSLNELNYTIIEKLQDRVYKLECDTSGTCGNKYFGDIIPVENIPNLQTATITELLIPGEDEEQTEAFRKRYFDSFNGESFGGNIKDYKEKVNAITGVGGVKVYPVWNGGGTVKLVIIGSDYNIPSVQLINDVQEQIDPTLNGGEGKGIAPIGHLVTVESVQETIVNIELNLIYQDGYTWNDVQKTIDTEIDKYFNELNSVWADTDNIVVRISQIERRILDISGIVDISNTIINNKTENLIISSNNIIKRGDVIEQNN